MVEGTAQRLDELRRIVSEKARAVVASGVKVSREIDDLLTAETDLTNYLEDRVRGQADALQAAQRENVNLRASITAHDQARAALSAEQQERYMREWKQATDTINELRDDGGPKCDCANCSGGHPHDSSPTPEQVGRLQAASPDVTPAVADDLPAAIELVELWRRDRAVRLGQDDDILVVATGTLIAAAFAWQRDRSALQRVLAALDAADIGDARADETGGH